MGRLSILLLLLLASVKCYRVEVHLTEGTVVGTKQLTIYKNLHYYAFYQIPYAAPPIGMLRFQDSKPVKKRNRHYMANTEFRGSCAQPHIVHKNNKFGHENCLYLNVYSADLSASAAVLVWFHGYAFFSSFSHLFSGDFLIDHNIVFVSVNYRLGVQGFLKLNDSDSNANMGLKDIVRALRWINKNINNFGGDQTKVTVMGNGSAASYLSLLLMTKWRKLFTRMILHSGGIFSPSIFQGDPNLEKIRLMKKLGKDSDMGLRNTPSKRIVDASKEIYSNLEIINSQRPVVQFTPIIEKKSKHSLITSLPTDFFERNSNYRTNISVMIGFDTQESISEIIPFSSNPKFLKVFDKLFKFMVPFSDGCRFNYSSKTYKRVAADIKSYYFKGDVSEASIHEFTKYSSDLIKYPIFKFIKLLSKLSIKPFVFKFNYRGKFNAMKMTSLPENPLKIRGAASGDELCYLMKCEPMRDHYFKIYNETTDKDKILVELISQVWAEFVKKGDPNTKLLSQQAHWLPMTETADNLLVLDRNITATNTDIEMKMYKFWNNIYDKYYAESNCISERKDEL